MKYSLLLLLLAVTFTSTAQIQRREPYTPKPKPKKEKKQHHPPKMVELGFDIGYCPIEYGDGSIERISLSSRTEKHIQLFGHAEYVSSIFRKDIGLDVVPISRYELAVRISIPVYVWVIISALLLWQEDKLVM